MAKFKFWLLSALTTLATLSCTVVIAKKQSDGAISSADLPLEARDSSTSVEEEDIISTSYVLPNQIFNDGKPYYAGKDPISGQPDFNAKKPAGIETAANEVVDPKEKIVLSSSSPNIHDFLNLPVKYSSSKFVYPLVSSSYANLKYQGSNKNYITNKKPTSVVASVTPSPDHHYFTVPTTKLTPVSPTAAGFPFGGTSTSSTGSSSSSTSTTTTTTTTTSRRPATNGTTPKSTTQSTSTSQNPTKYTTLAPMRKPIPISTSTLAPKISTTRKKFIITKKYPSSTVHTNSPIPVRMPEQRQNATAAPKPTFTTRHPTPPANIFPTDSPASASNKFVPSTSQPVAFTEDPAGSPAFSPMPSSTIVPTLNAGDVYQTLGQKHHEAGQSSMSLADIFNSLAEEESAITSNNQGGQGFDAEGNLIQPLVPSQPSPFATQKQHQQQRPKSAVATTAVPASGNPQQPVDQKVSSNGQENMNNEYVSYQVQQPNVMQYRPAPGTINNVVISPGQHSASFVLGSQQQVGTNAFGTVQKEPLFSKTPSVQYGTVISEDISTLKRPEQNINNAQPPNAYQQPAQRPTEETPAPPSPYQQLPLVGSNMRQKPSNQQQQTPPAPSPPSTQSSYLQAQQDNKNLSPNSQTQDTKELLVSTNIRFPSNEDQVDELHTNPASNSPPAAPQVNGHAQPLSLQQIQNSNPVVFPNSESEHSSQTSNESQNQEDVEIQKHQVLTMNQHKQKINFPPVTSDSAPSQHMEPPPIYPPALTNSVHETNRPQTNRPPSFKYNEFTRKPLPGITRPNPDRHLPNILPQFRPNAKISSGHQSTNFNQEPGNIRITGQPPMRPNPSPQFSHRRQPLMHQLKRFPVNRNSNYPAGPPPPPPPPSTEANRRVYRLPPYGGQGMQYLERPHFRRPLPYSMRPTGGYPMERHVTANTNTEAYQTLPHQSVMAPERLAAFEEDDLVINEPPQPMTPSQEHKTVDETKLEPVVTLQMLQAQKKPLILATEDTGSGEIQVPSVGETETTPTESLYSQNGLYVVYPMKKGATNQDVHEGAESKDPLPTIAHIESPSGSEYQNTPFSVVRDQPQEPILMVKSKKQQPPQSQQQPQQHRPPQHNNEQQLKDKFPYPIEKPDPSYSDLNAAQRSPGVLVAPRIINGGYITETPIAIAYTPTEPNAYRRTGHKEDKYSNVNLASSVIGEIRPDTQTEEGVSNNDVDVRGQNLEKNFMAPFYPSVSLGAVTSAPTNGWSILPSTTASSIYEKNNINRADVQDGGEDANIESENAEGTTKSFEIDSFQPELQSGFKPIYPPGYRIDGEEDVQQQREQQPSEHQNDNMPLALASRMERPNRNEAAVATSTSTLSPSTTSTTLITSTTERPQEISTTTMSSTSTTATNPVSPTPTERKKTNFETSLAALLFGDDNEEANDAESRKQHSTAQSGPRNIPRMGPRNMKLS